LILSSSQIGWRTTFILSNLLEEKSRSWGAGAERENRSKEARVITVLQASSRFTEAGMPFLPILVFFCSNLVARILCEGNLITFAQFKARVNSLHACTWTQPSRATGFDQWPGRAGWA